MAEADKATGKFGTCCNELKEAMAGEDFEPLVAQGDDGVLYLTVGLVDLDDDEAGMVDHPNIKMATSVIDYVFRLLGMEYLGKTDFVQVPPKKEELRCYLNKEKKETAADAAEAEAKEVKEAKADEERKESSQLSAASVENSNLDAIRASSGAPLCIECGGMTKRNGSCYVCLDCGATTGCS